VAGQFPVESERVENLERALRVAERKKDADKVATLRRKLEELVPPSSSSSSNNNKAPASGPDKASELRPQRHYPLRGSVAVTVPPYSSARLALWLHVRAVAAAKSFDGEAVHRGLNVYEKKQGDHVVKVVPFCCHLMEQLHLADALPSPVASEAGELVSVVPARLDLGPIHVAAPAGFAAGQDFVGSALILRLEVGNKTGSPMLLSARCTSPQLEVTSGGDQVVVSPRCARPPCVAWRALR
jgi:hypothetical protein